MRGRDSGGDTAPTWRGGGGGTMQRGEHLGAECNGWDKMRCVEFVVEEGGADKSHF